jgi:hypothetical protein
MNVGAADQALPRELRIVSGKGPRKGDYTAFQCPLGRCRARPKRKTPMNLGSCSTYNYSDARRATYRSTVSGRLPRASTQVQSQKQLSHLAVQVPGHESISINGQGRQEQERENDNLLKAWHRRFAPSAMRLLGGDSFDVRAGIANVGRFTIGQRDKSALPIQLGAHAFKVGRD